MYKIFFSGVLTLVVSGCASIEPMNSDIPISSLSTSIRFPSDVNDFVKSKDRFFKYFDSRRVFSTNSYSGYLSNERYFDDENRYIYWSGAYLVSAGGNRYMDSYTEYRYNVDCKKYKISNLCTITTLNGHRVENSPVTVKYAPILSEKKHLN